MPRIVADQTASDRDSLHLQSCRPAAAVVQCADPPARFSCLRNGIPLHPVIASCPPALPFCGGAVERPASNAVSSLRGVDGAALQQPCHAPRALVCRPPAGRLLADVTPRPSPAHGRGEEARELATSRQGPRGGDDETITADSGRRPVAVVIRRCPGRPEPPSTDQHQVV